MMASRVSPSAFFLLIAPLLLTLAASAMQKYLFQDRVILFFCPVLATLVAAGIAYVSRAIQHAFLAMILTAVCSCTRLTWPSSQSQAAPI